jgi:hypothetical protein
MSQENVEIVRRLYDAIAQRDSATVLLSTIRKSGAITLEWGGGI